MRVFVTGGAGFIGSHICVELLTAGHAVTVFDNFSNGSPEALVRAGEVAGKPVESIRGDIRDPQALAGGLAASGAEAVIHCAALKVVSHSALAPLDYYETNIVGTLNLLRAVQSLGIGRLVFSSSASVYGEPEELPIRESHRLDPVNPYGRSKLAGEWICRDFQKTAAATGIAILRYFNPVGAHESGLLGENTDEAPNNLMPVVAQVAAGKRNNLVVHGGDYATADGTCVRDYVHVVDVAAGHVETLRQLQPGRLLTANLGTGAGHSVLEVIHSFERVSGRRIPHPIGPRRPGDASATYADAGTAERLLGWKAGRDLEAMCRDAWRWQCSNPDGYAGAKTDTKAQHAG